MLRPGFFISQDGFGKVWVIFQPGSLRVSENWPYQKESSLLTIIIQPSFKGYLNFLGVYSVIKNMQIYRYILMTLAHDPSFPATKKPMGNGTIPTAYCSDDTKDVDSPGAVQWNQHPPHRLWSLVLQLSQVAGCFGWLLSLLIGEASSKSLLYFGCVSVLQIFEANKIVWWKMTHFNCEDFVSFFLGPSYVI